MAALFRPMTLDDVDAIVAVLCAVSANPGMAADFRHDASEQARGEIADSVTYVICSDGQRIGRLRVVRVDEYIEIAGLQVHPDWQGRGIGTAVINEIFAESDRTGVPVELDVAKNNPDAERLYVRLGFRRIAEKEHDYRMRRA
jgi:ribosomal protein S18 acetylase RimI-like enzyme